MGEQRLTRLGWLACAKIRRDSPLHLYESSIVRWGCEREKFCLLLSNCAVLMDLKRNIKRSLLGVKDDCCGNTLSDGCSETVSLCLRLQHAQSLLTALERLRNREELCDVTLKIAETEIKAHRVVLAAVSPYFNAMFTGDHKESSQNVIQLNGLDPSAVCSFVEFAYVAKVKITVDNVQSLLTAASLLQVESLVEKCCHFLESELHPSNCLGIRRFAESHGCFALSKIAKQYAMRNFDQTTQLEEFLQCSIEGVIEFLSEDILYVRHEEEIYEAALRWLNYSKQERLEKFPKLAEVIRFPLMAWEFLVTKVLDDGLITSNPHTLYLFEEARRYHLAPQLHHEMNQGSRLKPRKLYGQAEWIYVIGGETSPGNRMQMSNGTQSISNHITNTNILDLVYLRHPLVEYWSTLLANTLLKCWPTYQPILD